MTAPQNECCNIPYFWLGCSVCLAYFSYHAKECVSLNFQALSTKTPKRFSSCLITISSEFSFDEKSFAELSFGEMSFGEMSFVVMSFGEMSKVL